MGSAPIQLESDGAEPQTQVFLTLKLMVLPCTLPSCLWIIERLKPESFLPALGERQRTGTSVPNHPLPLVFCEGAALRMLSSRALAQQWRGTSSGFGRPQTMLGEDSAAGHGKFQALSKSHPGHFRKPGPLRLLCSHVRGPRTSL